MLIHCQSQQQYINQQQNQQQTSVNLVHAQSTDYGIFNPQTANNKETYKRKIQKIQKRADHLRKSTMEINYQINSELQGMPLTNNFMHARSTQQNHYESMQENNPSSDANQLQNQLNPPLHSKSIDSTQNYFEKKLNDRRKRTFNILKRFNPSLASEVIYKEKFHEHKLSKIDIESRRRYEALIKIQKVARGYLARKNYNKLLCQNLVEQEERMRREHEVLMEQWLIEQETARLQRQIDEKNRLFKYQLKKREDAAVLIQRAFRQWLRKKYQGISTTQILERNELQAIEQDTLYRDYLGQELQQSFNSSSVTRKRRSPRSVGAYHRVGRGQLANRMRQLQIETSNQGLIEGMNVSGGQNTTLKMQGSTTPIDLSMSSSYLLNNNSFVQSKTPQNMANFIRLGRIVANMPDQLDHSMNEPVASGVSQLNSNEESKEKSSSGGGQNAAGVSAIVNKLLMNQVNLENSNGIPNNGVFSGYPSVFSLQSDGLNSNDSNQSPFINFQKNLLGSGHQDQAIQNFCNQLDNSLNNLFDSLQQPPVHHNRFDLTQKLNDNFHELIQHCETIHELESLATPIPSQMEEIQEDEEYNKEDKAKSNQQSLRKKRQQYHKNSKQGSVSKNNQEIAVMEQMKQGHSNNMPPLVNEKNIYNKFLREESIKDQMLIQDDNKYQNFKANIKEESYNSLLMLIPPPSCSQDNTFSSGEASQILKDGNVFSSGGAGIHGADCNQLNEDDFPMTQLIKEKTIFYNRSVNQNDHLQTEESQWHQESHTNHNISNNENQYMIEQRFMYFRELVTKFNEKEVRLRQLQEKRQELLKNISFYKQLFTNFNTMQFQTSILTESRLDSVGGGQSHRGGQKGKKFRIKKSQLENIQQRENQQVQINNKKKKGSNSKDRNNK